MKNLAIAFLKFYTVRGIRWSVQNLILLDLNEFFYFSTKNNALISPTSPLSFSLGIIGRADFP